MRNAAVDAGSRSSIVVVSGLPRSGTSMLMHMLQQGGLPLCVDNIRAPDIDNPRGYFEYESVRTLQQDSSFIGAASGKAIKVVSHLLQALPSEFDYRVIFLERDLYEILGSQKKMMARLHAVSSTPTTSGAAATDLESDVSLCKRHLTWISDWLRRQPNMETLYLAHSEVLRDPSEAACRVCKFLGIPLDEDRMARAVDTTLYRTKETAAPSAAYNC